MADRDGVIDMARNAGSSLWRRHRAVPVTSTADGHDHLVAVDTMNSQAMRALCGRAVLAAPLVCPPGPVCTYCAANVHEAHHRALRRDTRPGPVGRLVALAAWLFLRSPAVRRPLSLLVAARSRPGEGHGGVGVRTPRHLVKYRF